MLSGEVASCLALCFVVSIHHVYWSKVNKYSRHWTYMAWPSKHHKPFTTFYVIWLPCYDVSVLKLLFITLFSCYIEKKTGFFKMRSSLSVSDQKINLYIVCTVKLKEVYIWKLYVLLREKSHIYAIWLQFYKLWGWFSAQ
jgi:hypothetical protein